MNAPVHPLYTNEVSAEFLRSLDAPLVGSRLCNGDEIINTLQGGCLLVGREGVSMAEDFLPSIKEEEHQ